MATSRQDAPEDIDALRAALIAERARTAQVEAELAVAPDAEFRFHSGTPNC